MPVISMFLNYHPNVRRSGRAAPQAPIHAEYSGHQAVISLDGEVLQGELPGTKWTC